MREVRRYYVGKYGLVEGEALGRLSVVLAAEFDRVTAERDSLHDLLTAADERAGELLIMLRMAWVDTEVSAENCRRIDAALKPAEVKCKTCNGTRIVSDGAMYCSSGGIPFECGPIECVKDCPDCSKP